MFFFRSGIVAVAPFNGALVWSLTTRALKVFWAIAMKQGNTIAVSMKILFMDI